MTPEAQRIAIAEACPDLFEIHETYASELPDGKFRKYLTYKGEGVEGIEIDPLSDLNAMHEAEKVLPENKRIEYAYKLANIVGFTGSWWSGGVNLQVHYAMLRATAPQRAEAFLRTLGLWKD